MVVFFSQSPDSDVTPHRKTYTTSRNVLTHPIATIENVHMGDIQMGYTCKSSGLRSGWAVGLPIGLPSGLWLGSGWGSGSGFGWAFCPAL